MKQKLKSFFTKRNKLLLVALIAILILLVSVNAARTKVLTDGQIINNISSLTNVPDARIDPPGIFRIEDPSQMPAFFKDAKSGDVTILFYKSAKAIIYSPKDNRIVNQGPIVNDEAVKVQAAKSDAAKTSTTTTSGLATSTNR